MSTFEVICRFDEAIDDRDESMSEEARRDFIRTGDVTLLKFFDGKEPTRFYCRRLKSSEMQTVLSHHSEADRFAAAFARGVTKADGLYTESGSRRSFVRNDLDRPVAPRVIDETFDAGQVQEVGAAIYSRSILGKGKPAAWPLPATSRDAMVGLASHRAALIREQDATSKKDTASPSSRDPSEPSPLGE